MFLRQWLQSFIALMGILSPLFSYTQQQATIDSLEQLLSQETNPIEQARLLSTIGNIYFYTQPNKTILYHQKAIQLIPQNDSIKNNWVLGNLYINLGNIYGSLNNISTGLLLADSALFFYRKAKHHKGIADVYTSISNVYCTTQDYLKATKFLLKSMHIHDSLENWHGLAINLSAMVTINSAQKDYNLALQHSKKALALYLKSSYVPEHLGLANLNIGSSFANKDQPDSAIYYYHQALPHFESANYLGGMARIYSQLGLLYKNDLEDLQQAAYYLQKALDLKEHIHSTFQLLELKNNFASLLLKRKDYTQSIHLYKQVLANPSSNKQLKKAALAGLADNYKNLGDIDKTHDYLLQYIMIKDSILDERKQEQMAALEIAYETEKKEQTILLLSKDKAIQQLKTTQQQQWIYALIIILVLVIVVAYLILRQNRYRSKQQNLQLKHRLLRNQMNPHFIFNALIAIQSFVYDNEPKAAGLYLAAFAKLVRAILENSRKEYITLEKEIQWLENYLKLQLLRFDHQFDYQINIDPQIEVFSVLIPPMLTQPFIENALEHGLKKISYRGKLEVSFQINEQQLEVQVKDNGIGLETSTTASSNPKHISLATTITEERLRFLNREQQEKIYFNIHPNQPSGLIVAFKIPLNYQ